jgi:hypothetical protein
MRVEKKRKSGEFLREIVINPAWNSEEKFLYDNILETKNLFLTLPNNPNNFLFFRAYQKTREIKPAKASENWMPSIAGTMWNQGYFTRMARYKAKKLLNCNHHFLRHCRATHMITEFKLSAFGLKLFGGWNDLNIAEYYVNLHNADLHRSMGIKV